MESTFWQLRYRKSGHGQLVEERLHTETDFRLALQVAYRSGATDLVSMTPDGHRFTEAALRRRYPPE